MNTQNLLELCNKLQSDLREDPGNPANSISLKCPDYANKLHESTEKLSNIMQNIYECVQ